MHHHPADLSRTILPTLAEYARVPVCQERAPWNAKEIHLLWVQHMSGSPVSMPDDCAPMRRWLDATEIGTQISGEEVDALNEWFEAMNGMDVLVFEQSCGASICDIVRLLRLIGCRSFTACVTMRHILYEDFPEWDHESVHTVWS